MTRSRDCGPGTRAILAQPQKRDKAMSFIAASQRVLITPLDAYRMNRSLFQAKLCLEGR